MAEFRWRKRDDLARRWEVGVVRRDLIQRDGDKILVRLEGVFLLGCFELLQAIKQVIALSSRFGTTKAKSGSSYLLLLLQRFWRLLLAQIHA